MSKIVKLTAFKKDIINRILFWCEYNPSLIFTCKLFCSYAKKIRTPTFFTDAQLSLLTNLQILDCGYSKFFTNSSLSLMTNLQTLHCGFNRIFTDNSLSLLTNLQTLNCCLNIFFTNSS
ncbi:hypothetical protein OAG24_01190, partial [bacterium]|nr:hypothetical protein [bacterium]